MLVRELEATNQVINYGKVWIEEWKFVKTNSISLAFSHYQDSNARNNINQLFVPKFLYERKIPGGALKVLWEKSVCSYGEIWVWTSRWAKIEQFFGLLRIQYRDFICKFFSWEFQGNDFRLGPLWKKLNLYWQKKWISGRFKPNSSFWKLQIFGILTQGPDKLVSESDPPWQG